MKVKLHSRIKIPVEFSDVGLVQPNKTFEVTETRGEELIQLGYVESVAQPAISTKKKPSIRKAE